MACRATDSGGGSRALRRRDGVAHGVPRDEERGAAGLAGTGRWAGAAACERLTACMVGRGARWVRKRSFYYYKVSLSRRGGLHCGAREQRPGRGRGRALELGGGRWEASGGAPLPGVGGETGDADERSQRAGGHEEVGWGVSGALWAFGYSRNCTVYIILLCLLLSRAFVVFCIDSAC